MTAVEIVILIAVLLVAIIGAGYFAGLETGSYRLRSLRLRQRLSSGDKRAKRIDKLFSDRQGLIITTLVGTNLFVYLSTAVCTGFYHQLMSESAWPSILSTLTMAPLLFVFAEVLPKNLFERHADTLVYVLSGSLSLFRRLFAPAVWLLKRIAQFWALLFPARQAHADPFYSRSRLWFALDESARQGLLTPYQMSMAANIMRLKQTTVEQLMVPARDCEMLSVQATPGELKELGKKGHTRYPVCAGEITNIVGVLHVLEALAPQNHSASVSSLMKPAVKLARNLRIEPALTRLRAARQPLGIVVDEQGNALGIVTIKDLLEEIVGGLEIW